MSETHHIPDDLAACQALLVEMAKTVTEQKETIDEQSRTITEQKLTIAELMRQAFRHRSERYLADPGQLQLDFGDSDEAADAADGLSDAVEEAELIVGEHRRRRRKPREPRNEQLPDWLERREVEAPVPDDVKDCPTHGPRKLIGYDVLETLMFEPPELWVKVTKIAKYICVDEPECGVAQPPREPGLVEGNRYDTSVAAEIITGKMGYHLPIYRQQDYFAGSGWTPSRSTLLNIQKAAAAVLHPFALWLREQVIASGLLGTDDTRVTLLLPNDIPEACADDPKSQRIHEVFTAARTEGRTSISGRMWAYRSLTIPVNVFDFTVSRHRDGPDDVLIGGNFVGTIIADCYSGYQGITLRSDERILRAACNAHARRKIFEAKDNYPMESCQLLAIYQQLYDVNDRAARMTVAERERLHESESRPLWERMREVLDSEAASRVLPKDKFAEALGYLRRNWGELTLYLSDGRLPIDNNETEQLMKQVATGRKNWLFTGSVAAGERMADQLTVVSSALRNHLDIRVYVKEVLDQLLAGTTDYAPLRPDHWAAEHPEHIRKYRVEERRDRADAKHFRRAARRARQAPGQ